MKSLNYLLGISLVVFSLTSCAPSSRLGMIKDSATGLQYGSVIEKSFFVDSSQFENNKIKISSRNVSGDTSYNISSFVNSLERSFVEKGYRLSQQDFGIKFDITIEYSGHVQSNLSQQYAFLGGAAGGIAGYRSEAMAGEAIGLLTGATLGGIAGSYVTEDTYILIARVSIGISNKSKNQGKTVRFSSSPNLQADDDRSGVNYFDEVLTTKVAVFAGGRNVSQSEIIEGVRRRLHSIVSDII